MLWVMRYIVCGNEIIIIISWIIVLLLALRRKEEFYVEKGESYAAFNYYDCMFFYTFNGYVSVTFMHTMEVVCMYGYKRK